VLLDTCTVLVPLGKFRTLTGTGLVWVLTTVTEGPGGEFGAAGARGAKRAMAITVTVNTAICLQRLHFILGFPFVDCLRGNRNDTGQSDFWFFFVGFVFAPIGFMTGVALAASVPVGCPPPVKRVSILKIRHWAPAFRATTL
jgi:hypothetical protein